ncbi:uncharacterized protein N7458_005360 [Penicillium daleae]|uniref:Uncharacterized protein n=1 Tax=Penicillium daleae TaxID=63821 RepID=A0AAD6G4P5_9EURO|nr:uncharacterized protein N7458_005360 [Penicillium daleae]KAJ5454404.1 hypothetical protein N7458_005360 [Penicillium daleae]
MRMFQKLVGFYALFSRMSSSVLSLSKPMGYTQNTSRQSSPNTKTSQEIIESVAQLKVSTWTPPKRGRQATLIGVAETGFLQTTRPSYQYLEGQAKGFMGRLSRRA